MSLSWVISYSRIIIDYLLLRNRTSHPHILFPCWGPGFGTGLRMVSPLSFDLRALAFSVTNTLPRVFRSLPMVSGKLSIVHFRLWPCSLINLVISTSEWCWLSGLAIEWILCLSGPHLGRHGLRRFSRGIGGGGPQPGSVSVGLAFLSLFTEKCHLLIFN